MSEPLPTSSMQPERRKRLEYQLVRTELLVTAGVIAIGVITALVIAFGVLAGGDDLVVVINNESDFVLTAVEVNGGGVWSQAAPDIPPHGAARVLITQDFIESGLGVRFVANGEQFAKGDVAYVHSGGEGVFDVRPDLSIDATFAEPWWMP